MGLINHKSVCYVQPDNTDRPWYEIAREHGWSCTQSQPRNLREQLQVIRWDCTRDGETFAWVHEVTLDHVCWVCVVENFTNPRECDELEMWEPMLLENGFRKTTWGEMSRAHKIGKYAE